MGTGIGIGPVNETTRTPLPLWTGCRSCSEPLVAYLLSFGLTERSPALRRPRHQQIEALSLKRGQTILGPVFRAFFCFSCLSIRSRNWVPFSDMWSLRRTILTDSSLSFRAHPWQHCSRWPPDSRTGIASERSHPYLSVCKTRISTDGRLTGGNTWYVSTGYVLFTMGSLVMSALHVSSVYSDIVSLKVKFSSIIH